MTKRHSHTKRRCRRKRPFRHDPNPWPGLVGAPFALLLNLLVTTEEHNVKTDDHIPPEAMDTAQALIRCHYGFPDLDVDAEKGVGLSMIGGFSHVADCRELRIDRLHHKQVMASLRKRTPQPVDLDESQLRTSNVTDPQSLTEGKEEALAFWYKQRLLAFYFVGERDQIERLTEEPPEEELIWNTLEVVLHTLNPSEDLGVYLHPAFIPASNMSEVSPQNAMEWTETMKEAMDSGQVGSLSVISPPRSSYVAKLKREE